MVIRGTLKPLSVKRCLSLYLWNFPMSKIIGIPFLVICLVLFALFLKIPLFCLSHYLNLPSLLGYLCPCLLSWSHPSCRRIRKRNRSIIPLWLLCDSLRTRLKILHHHHFLPLIPYPQISLNI